MRRKGRIKQLQCGGGPSASERDAAIGAKMKAERYALRPIRNTKLKGDLENHDKRVVREIMGATEYTIVAEEMSGAKHTAFEIIGGIVKRHFDEDKLKNLLFAD